MKQSTIFILVLVISMGLIFAVFSPKTLYYDFYFNRSIVIRTEPYHFLSCSHNGLTKNWSVHSNLRVFYDHFFINKFTTWNQEDCSFGPFGESRMTLCYRMGYKLTPINVTDPKNVKIIEKTLSKRLSPYCNDKIKEYDNLSLSNKSNISGGTYVGLLYPAIQNYDFSYDNHSNNNLIICNRENISMIYGFRTVKPIFIVNQSDKKLCLNNTIVLLSTNKKILSLTNKLIEFKLKRLNNCSYEITSFKKVNCYGNLPRNRAPITSISHSPLYDPMYQNYFAEYSNFMILIHNILNYSDLELYSLTFKPNITYLDIEHKILSHMNKQCIYLMNSFDNSRFDYNKTLVAFVLKHHISAGGRGNCISVEWKNISFYLYGFKRKSLINYSYYFYTQAINKYKCLPNGSCVEHDDPSHLSEITNRTLIDFPDVKKYANKFIKFRFIRGNNKPKIKVLSVINCTHKAISIINCTKN